MTSLNKEGHQYNQEEVRVTILGFSGTRSITPFLLIPVSLGKAYDLVSLLPLVSAWKQPLRDTDLASREQWLLQHHLWGLQSIVLPSGGMAAWQASQSYAISFLSSQVLFCFQLSCVVSS